MTDKPWFLYIIECKDSKLYTGISNDVVKRVAAHNAGKGCRFTMYRHPVKLLYTEYCGTQSDARRREIEVKKFPKLKKLELINSKTL